MIAIVVTKDTKLFAIYHYSDDDYAEAYEKARIDLGLKNELIFEKEGCEELYNALIYDGDIVYDFTHQYLDSGLDLIFKSKFSFISD